MQYITYNMPHSLVSRVFSIGSPSDFETLALDMFQYQYSSCDFYREFCEARRITPAMVSSLSEIPFLPIQFFKTRDIVARGTGADLTFLSSGTTGMARSKHLVADPQVYKESFTRCFERFFGSPGQYVILALLPSYLEQGNSSLVYMTRELIAMTGNNESGFYLHNHHELADTLSHLDARNQPTILLGVSYALLDFSEKFTMQLKNCTVIETGGMKGRGREMVREELHATLRERLGVGRVLSEYGMTELLSQAYTNQRGEFECPPWMQVMIRDTYDPLSYVPDGTTGGINVIDLANVHSCSFIETEDLGKRFHGGTFEVLGRYDKSSIRGCNLMV